jgi:FkbM family methyltransferase
VNKRLQIASWWLQGKRNNITLMEIIKHTFKPGHHALGKSKIVNLLKEGPYYKVYFKNFKHPLYWPESEGFRCLYGFAGEILDPNGWHYYEIPETKVNNNDIVVDVGAAEGMFSYTVIGRAKKVYAIEPASNFIQAMKKTFAHYQNFELIQAAVSNLHTKGILKNNNLYLNIEDPDIPDGELVDVLRLDDIFDSQDKEITYLKADLEGYEIEMLEGARKTIQRYKPRIAITTYHKEDHPDRIKNFLEGLNPDYRFKFKGIEKHWGNPVMLHAW